MCRRVNIVLLCQRVEEESGAQSRHILRFAFDGDVLSFSSLSHRAHTHPFEHPSMQRKHVSSTYHRLRGTEMLMDDWW